MNSYRVFISYAHANHLQAERLVGILKDNGLTPLWDKNFTWGHGFPEQIKNYIACAHVFMPIISQESSERGWVHQEIGYANALNVPILPVSIDHIPGEMLQQLLAVRWSDNLQEIKEQVSFHAVENLVNHERLSRHALYECAQFHEDRTMMMVEYAMRVLELGDECAGCVRQKGALSSFHIPDKPVSHPIWRQRYHPIAPSEFRCHLLREERKALEKHAQMKGCRLIINPIRIATEADAEARIARLSPLVDFINSRSIGNLEIAICERLPPALNLTIVGDWFSAESVSIAHREGYRQTIFTRHAPTVKNQIEAFDLEFEDLLREQKLTPESSREAALNAIQKFLDQQQQPHSSQRKVGKEMRSDQSGVIQRSRKTRLQKASPRAKKPEPAAG